MAPDNPINRRRSERVTLRVPVIVKTKTRQGESVQEQTYTAVVNAHGGLMKLKMELQVGQPIILVNAQTKMEQGCRIVRVENPSTSGSSFAVAFEFDKPAPHFWPITFPPADWGVKPS